MKILIVDDNEMNRRLCRAILVQHGHVVLEAGNGAEGLEVARKESPALIFMDIQMPVMDGREALKRIKADPATRDVAIVALTSYAMKGDRESLLEAGFADYLSKPIDIDQFLEVVRRRMA